MTCPLCLDSQIDHVFEREDKRYGLRQYYQCQNCHLIFLDSKFWLTPHAEKERYDTHNNDLEDANYRKFLNQLCKPVAQRLAGGAQGLDFGCGPGPLMSKLFREKDFGMENYDPYYFPDKALLTNTYDFIVSSETAEHFHYPNLEFALFDFMLKPQAWLGIMTRTLGEKETFAEWWYHRDPTHVVFYSPETFQWIARRFNWDYYPLDASVFLFQKK